MRKYGERADRYRLRFTHDIVREDGTSFEAEKSITVELAVVNDIFNTGGNVVARNRIMRQLLLEIGYELGVEVRV